MKKVKLLLTMVLLSILFGSCDSVEPNYQGVLMENFGRNGKSDFKLVKGRVWTAGPGTQLYQVPLWEQRASFEDNGNAQKTLHLKAADNTEFTSRPVYSFKVIETKAVDVVFENKQLDGETFMKSLEDNILETKIYDIMKEESRKYVTDSLMATGGSLKFESEVQELVKKAFVDKGLELMTFSCQLEFTDKVRGRIDARNEVNTNISVIDQQIIEQRKKNELAELQAQEMIIKSRGLTQQILAEKFIDKWNGQTSLYGNTIPTMVRNIGQ